MTASDSTQAAPLQSENQDWLLAAFVQALNRGTFSGVGIVLLVGGQRVGGVAISGKEFMEKLGAAFDLGLERSTGESINAGREAFNDLAAQLYKPADSSGDEAEDSINSTPNYLHLRDVIFVSPTRETEQHEFPYWRFRLSEIQGWTLGKLNMLWDS
jgi:hypothetical protein